MSCYYTSLRNMFCVAVERVLNSWTVLKLAVAHGMGGRDSDAKAEWMVSAIDQWFTENANLEVYEVEEFLADVLNHEFDTIADDGSLTEIASMLCGFYKLCAAGEEDKIREKLSKLPAAATKNSLQSAVTSQEVAEDAIDDDGGGAGETSNTASTQDTAKLKQTDSNDTMETDEDGWQVVRRAKRK